jgi:hypothetical protein
VDDAGRPGVPSSPSSVNDETIVVALAAGVAGMLALEPRTNAGGGVAISVTTIPAAAYLGVAAGLGEFSTARSSISTCSAGCPSSPSDDVSCGAAF